MSYSIELLTEIPDHQDTSLIIPTRYFDPHSSTIPFPSPFSVFFTAQAGGGV